MNRSDTRVEASRLPKGKAECQQEAYMIGADGLAFLFILSSDQAPAFLLCESFPWFTFFDTSGSNSPTPLKTLMPFFAQMKMSLPAPKNSLT